MMSLKFLKSTKKNSMYGLPSSLDRAKNKSKSEDGAKEITQNMVQRYTSFH